MMVRSSEFVDARPSIIKKGVRDLTNQLMLSTLSSGCEKRRKNNASRRDYGIPVSGFYTSAGSIDSHPALKSVFSLQAPVSRLVSRRRAIAPVNGALFSRRNSALRFLRSKRASRFDEFSDYVKPFNTGTQDGYNFFQSGGVK